LKKAEKLNPKDIHIHLARAHFKVIQTRFKVSAGQPARRNIVEGLDSIKRALTVNPNFGEAYMVNGVLKILMSKISTNDKEQQTFLKDSRDSLKKGLEMNKNLEKIFSAYLLEKK
jgi:hypothetical protein